MDVLIAAVEVHHADVVEKLNHRLPIIQDQVKHWLDQFRVKRFDDVIKVGDKSNDHDKGGSEDDPVRPPIQEDNPMNNGKIEPTIEERLRMWLQQVRLKQSISKDDNSDGNEDNDDPSEEMTTDDEVFKEVSSPAESDCEKDGSYCIIYTTAEDNRTRVISENDDIHVTDSPVDSNDNIQTNTASTPTMDTGHDYYCSDPLDFSLGHSSCDSADSSDNLTSSWARKSFSSGSLPAILTSGEQSSNGTLRRKKSGIRLPQLPTLFNDNVDNPEMSHILLDLDSPTGTIVRRSSPEWITKEWERHHDEQRKSLTRYEEGFDMVNFPPKLQTSISLHDFDHVVKARSQPISSEEFQTLLDADGRLVDEHRFRQAVFRGGVDPKIRKEVWQFLFCLYPFHSTAREREIMRADYYIKYRALKSRWKKLLRDDEEEGSKLIHPGYLEPLEPTELDSASEEDPCCHVANNTPSESCHTDRCPRDCTAAGSSAGCDCAAGSHLNNGSESVQARQPCCRSAANCDSTQESDICYHSTQPEHSVLNPHEGESKPARLHLDCSLSEGEVRSRQNTADFSDDDTKPNKDSDCPQSDTCGVDNVGSTSLYPTLPNIEDIDKCFDKVVPTLNVTDTDESLKVRSCDEESAVTIMANCPSSPMPGSSDTDNFPGLSDFPSPDVREQLKFMEIQANVYAGRQPFDMDELMSCVRIIDKDVPRTDRDCAFFQGNSNPNLQILRDVLITYAGFHPDIGYAQGMNDILSQFLEVFLSEVEAYWCFTNYMDRIKRDFSEDGLVEKLDVVKQLLIEIDPDLWNYIEQLGLGDMTFCHRWMLLCFKREFSREAALKCFEVLSSYHLELTSMEAEIMRDKERRRDFENIEGKNRLIPGDSGNPDYTFAVFMCVTIMIEHRAALFKCNDSADVIEFICGLTNHLDLDELLAKSEVLFYRYCRKSIIDCFHVLDMPSNRK